MFEAYLKATPIVDYGHPAVVAEAKCLAEGLMENNNTKLKYKCNSIYKYKNTIVIYTKCLWRQDGKL